MSVMTARMAAACRDNSPRGLFVAIEHPDGTGYFSTGVGSRSWNGHTWAGTGKFGGITPIKHTSEIAIQDIKFSLSGVDPDIVNGLSDDVRNLSGKVWFYCLNYDNTVIADPYQLIDSLLDYQTFVVDGSGTCTVEITAHSGFYTLSRAIQEAWTPQNQKALHPTDTGMDMIPSLQNQNLQWLPVAPV
jgi:hypothetical protein